MVDAPASGAGILTGVEVRVFSWAPKINNIPHGLNLAGFLLLPEGGWAIAAADGKTTIRFNTQPPEGGCRFVSSFFIPPNSFNTQPPEGGCGIRTRKFDSNNGFNTQPPEGGCTPAGCRKVRSVWFQHTATRRWLPAFIDTLSFTVAVSTHSHPKVAATHATASTGHSRSFNTQPPEGGCHQNSAHF